MANMELARIVAHEEIAPGIWSLTLAASLAAEAKPGQFVSVFCRNERRLLPRPISICQMDPQKGTLRLVYRIAGAGTKELSGYAVGDTLRLMGPLGNGFPLDPAAKRPLLVGGGVGVPPMLGLAQALSAPSGEDAACDVTMLMGYRDAHTFLSEDLSACGRLIITTDDGSVGLHGTVAEAWKDGALSPDVIYACGPKPMLRAVKQFAMDRQNPCWLSLEERMACGIGACLGCVCETAGEDAHSHVHNARVCTDGPVFAAADVVL